MVLMSDFPVDHQHVGLDLSNDRLKIGLDS